LKFCHLDDALGPRFSYVPGKEKAGDGGMVYVVRAIHVDGVTGTFTIENNTLREAKESAKSLREMGLWMIIVGPDGKTIEDETKEDP
jgi:hypothetical protein